MDVDHGVVGAVEVGLEEFLMKLGKFGPFESVVAGDGAVVGGDFLGAAAGGFVLGFESGAEAFGAEDGVVVAEVVGDELAAVFDLFEEGGEGLADGDALGEGLGLGEAVFDPEGFGGDFPAVGLDEVDALGDAVAVLIVGGPGELDHAGPIIEVGDGGVVFFGESGGLGVEDEIHAFMVWLESSP